MEAVLAGSTPVHHPDFMKTDLMILYGDLPRTAGVIFLALVASFFMRRSIEAMTKRLRGYQRVSGTRIERRAKTVAALLNNASMFLIWGTAVSMVLAILGINIVPLVAGAGVLGLAVAFGAQAFVRDVISGLLIIIEDYISVGDKVEIAGKTGRVESVRLRTTVIRDEKGKATHIIPNSQISIISKVD